MSYDPAIIKLQIIASLGLAVRDVTGIPSYTDSLGDQTYATDEITRAVTSAGTELLRAVCETEGHPLRKQFTSQQTLTHQDSLPNHYGPIGVPRITPYVGASYTIVGKRKSVEEISAYRANVLNRYTTVAHNGSSGGMHSKLAGFYAIDNNIFHFTGFSADADITDFTENDIPLLPETFHPWGIALAIAFLKKDGDSSDIFEYYNRLGQTGLAMIRGIKMDQPSLSKTIGVRDTGQK